MNSIRSSLLILIQFFLLSLNQAQTFNGQGGLLVPPGAPAATVGITESIATVSGVGTLGVGCSYIENVTIDLEHTFVGDIAILLIAPGGEILEFSSGNGGAGDNFQVTVFTDNTLLFITQGFPPYNGTFRPEGRQTSTMPPFSNVNPLGTFTFSNTFDGINADGDWTLFINDYVAIDVGILNSWSITFNVGGGPQPTVDLGPDITICPGESATLTANVTPSATDYLWSTGATSPGITVSPANTTEYYITVTNNGCVDLDTVIVEVDPDGVMADAGPDVGICNGESTELIGSGGGVGADYSWSNGANTAQTTVNPVTTTTYTLTVSEGSCEGTDEVTVTVNPIPVANAGPDFMICDGETTTLSASGGSAPADYQWNTGQSGPTINVSPVVNTTYTLTVTTNGCSATDEVAVVVNPIPFIDAGVDQIVCLGESVTLTATGNPGNYTWSTGQTGPTIIVSPSFTTLYSVTLSVDGCIAEDQVMVDVTEVIADAGPDQIICEGESATLEGAGGTAYQWNTGDNGPVIVVTPSTTTSYILTVTDNTGCSATDEVIVEVNLLPFADAGPDEFITLGESITLVATGGGTYLWSTGDTGPDITVSPTLTTTYTVTVTLNGCTSTDEVTVFVNEPPSVDLGPDLTICLGETLVLDAEIPGPFDIGYDWSNGETSPSIIVSPPSTGFYSVTVTDFGSGLSSIDTINITVLMAPSDPVDITGPTSICVGTAISYTVNAVPGAMSYMWTISSGGAILGGQGSTMVNVDWGNTSPGTISVIAVNSCGSSSAIEINVELEDVPADPGPITGDLNPCAFISTDYSIPVLPDATTYLWTISGGALISGGQGSEEIAIDWNNSPGGDLCVQAENQCGLSTMECITITTTTTPVADAGPDLTICGLSAGMSATGTGSWSVTGGPGMTSFSDIEDPGAQITVDQAGVYSFTWSIDINGCEAEDEVVVEFFVEPSYSDLQEECNSTNDAYILTFTVTGGSAPYSVNGMPLAGTEFNSSSIPSGTAYAFTVVDANGCEIEITGNVLCNCSSSAGTLPGQQIDACVDGTLSIPLPDGIVLDFDDVLGYALHDGSFPSGIILTQSNPVFGFQPGLNPGTVYYVSAFVGSPGGNGLPDLNDQCLDFSNGVPVVFHPLPDVEFAIDPEVCLGDCAELMLTFTGSGPFDLTYSDGLMEHTVEGLDDIHIENLCPVLSTIYSIQSINDQNCNNEPGLDFEVNVGIPPNAGSMSEPLVICAGESQNIRLEDLLEGEDTGGSWQEISAIPSTGNAFDALSATFNATGQQPGVYTFSYNLDGEGICPDGQSEVNITISSLPVADAGDDLEFGCDQTQVFLDGTGSDVGASIEYLWSTQDGSILDGGNALQATAGSPGSYILQVTDRVSGCFTTDTIEVNQITAHPESVVITQAPPQCADSCNAQLHLDDLGSGFEYAVNGSGFSQESAYNNICSGDLLLEVIDPYGCQWDTLIEILEPVPLSLELGPDTTIFLGDEILLQAISSAEVASIVWVPGQENCTGICLQLLQSPDSDVTYTAMITDINGCQASASQTIFVESPRNIFIPNAFSPNGDNINDLFRIFSGPSVAEIRNFRIFSRSGAMVFKGDQNAQTGNELTWDGRLNGRDLEGGVYVYVFEIEYFDGTIELISGDVTLLR